MQVHIESESAVHRRVEITVPASVINKQIQAAYSRLGQRVSIPGFRRGKVPMSVLRKRYAGQVAADVTNQIVDDAWQQAMEDHNLTPVARPEWEVELINPGQDYGFTVKIEVPPEFEVKPFSEISLEMDEYTFEDSHIDHEIEHLVEQAATFETVEDRDTAENGDMIVFDFNGSIDDVPFEGGTAQGVSLELGSGRFIPGFEEQVVGQKVGEDFDITVTFPEDYHADHLAGKDAKFACKLHELKAKKTPELDDELAKKFGAEDVEDLKAKVREAFTNRWESVAKRDVFDELRTLIAGQYDFELPPTLFSRRLDELKQQEAQAEAQKQAAGEGESNEGAEASKDEDALKAQATQDLRCELVLDTISEQEGIQAEEREINAAVESTVQQMPHMAAQLRQYFRRPEQRAGIARSIRHDKALDYVLSKANVTRNPKPVPEHNHDHDHDDHDHDHD